MRVRRFSLTEIAYHWAQALPYLTCLGTGIALLFLGDGTNTESREAAATIHLLARARGRAVDALFDGLSYDPDNKPINKILDGIGRRREPVVSFLPRDNILNVYFGKKRHEKFERRREEARQRRQKQRLAKGKLTAADARLRKTQTRSTQQKKKKNSGQL